MHVLLVNSFFFRFLLAFKHSMWNGCTRYIFFIKKKSINLSDCYYVLQRENEQNVIETTQKNTQNVKQHNKNLILQ